MQPRGKPRLLACSSLQSQPRCLQFLRRAVARYLVIKHVLTAPQRSDGRERTVTAPAQGRVDSAAPRHSRPRGANSRRCCSSCTPRSSAAQSSPPFAPAQSRGAIVLARSGQPSRTRSQRARVRRRYNRRSDRPAMYGEGRAGRARYHNDLRPLGIDRQAAQRADLEVKRGRAPCRTGVVTLDNIRCGGDAQDGRGGGEWRVGRVPRSTGHAVAPRAPTVDCGRRALQPRSRPRVVPVQAGDTQSSQRGEYPVSGGKDDPDDDVEPSNARLCSHVFPASPERHTSLGSVPTQTTSRSARLALTAIMSRPARPTDCQRQADAPPKHAVPACATPGVPVNDRISSQTCWSAADPLPRALAPLSRSKTRTPRSVATSICMTRVPFELIVPDRRPRVPAEKRGTEDVRPIPSSCLSTRWNCPAPSTERHRERRAAPHNCAPCSYTAAPIRGPPR